MHKIRTIEGLRGVLALWVVLGHVLAAAGLGEHWRGPFKVIAAGGNAVDSFIIVSGFVIFYLLDTAHESYGKFIWRRFLRLYPVYLICLIAAMTLLPMTVTAFSQAPWPHSLNVNRVVIAQASLAHLVENSAAHLLMVHALIPDWLLPSANYVILGQAWSFSLEWQFYVLAPILFAALTAGGAQAMAVIIGACALHFLVGGGEGVLSRHVPMFAIGIVCYFAWRHPWRPQMPLFAPVGIALAYLSTHSPGIVVWMSVFLAAYAPDSFGSVPSTGFLNRLPPCWSVGFPIRSTSLMRWF